MSVKRIGTTDIAAEGISCDLFHIETYIDGLSTFITQCNTPMTVSIQGDWGSGKTSMMNMIKEKISDSVCPIWFNTWQFSQFDMGSSLVFSMMEVLLDELGCEPKIINKIMSGLVGFARRTVKVMTDSAVCGAAADIAEEIMTPESAGNYAKEIMELKTKFQKAVDEKIKSSGKDRVVVFVDDLDRLQPEKAVELLEVMKLFIECSNCVFVIAVDYDVVTRGIRQKYGEDVGEEKGKSFFDKIIQLPFKVPVAQYDIKNYVRNMLKNMNISASDEDIELFKNLIQTSIGLNPRSMKRLFNTYQLLDIITRSSITGLNDAVRQKILFATLCMQMGHESLYQHLASTPFEAELLEQLGNAETAEDCLSEIISGDSPAERSSKYFNKLKRFTAYFYSAIQCDSDNSISEEELNNLRSVLKCSSVVSVSSDDESIESNTEWDDRYANRKLAEKINSTLVDLGTLKIWLPRKAKDDVKISDVSAYMTLPTNEGFEVTYEYYIRRTGTKLFVDLMLTSRKEPKLFSAFGDDPLELGVTPEKLDWGRYLYSHILTLTDNDAAEKIAELFRRAYDSLQKYL